MGLAFRDNVTYENFDLGAVGGAIAQGAGIASAMTDGIGSFINGLKGSGSAELAKLAGVTAAKSVLPAKESRFVWCRSTSGIKDSGWRNTKP